jgi:hypothetical protein
MWCTIFNYILLIVWVVFATAGHDWMCRLCTKLFRVSAERVEQVNYNGIAFYKLAVIFLNLVPFLALLIVAK